MFTLTAANVVVLARNYNPSIFSPQWLASRGVLPTIPETFVHTPLMVHIETEGFSFLVNEQRLQVVSKNIDPSSLRSITAVGASTVRLLPETPYTAIGVNLHFGITEDSFTLDRLFTPDREFLGELFGESYSLGGRVKFGFEQFTSSCDITPPQDGQAVRVVFNFHADVTSSEELLERLSEHAAILEKAHVIMEGISHGG